MGPEMCSRTVRANGAEARGSSINALPATTTVLGQWSEHSPATSVPRPRARLSSAERVASPASSTAWRRVRIVGTSMASSRPWVVSSPCSTSMGLTPSGLEMAQARESSANSAITDGVSRSAVDCISEPTIALEIEVTCTGTENCSRI